MWLLEQNSFSPSSWFCRPWNVSENKIRSSVHSKWAIISLLIHIPWAVDRYVSRSDIYFLNNNPLATPPWLTPSLLRIIELTRPLFFMRNYVLLYKFSQRIEDGAMPTTFYNLIEQNMTIYEIKCFGEVNKAYHKVWPDAQLSLN